LVEIARLLARQAARELAERTSEIDPGPIQRYASDDRP
jgi:hypothetical protein